MDAVAIGHIIIETIVFPDQRVLHPVLGSPAAYSTVALARLGNRVQLCTKVGDDLPKAFIEVFQKAGVDLGGMKFIGKHSTQNKLIYSTLESKRVEYLTKAPRIEIDDLPRGYQETNVFYLCPMDYEVSFDVAQELYRQGKELIVDLGGYGGATSATHPHGDQSKIAPAESIIHLCRIVKASVEDCQYIFGPAGAQDPERHYAAKLLEMGARRVVLTLGGKGVFYSDSSLNRAFPPLSCEIVDTTGAGDAFAAGMVHAYLRDRDDVKGMITFGQATACCVIERTGGVSPERMPTRKEVQARIEREVHDGHAQGGSDRLRKHR
jgi:sugar/nucleoside kinase (ribokinase family)